MLVQMYIRIKAWEEKRREKKREEKIASYYQISRASPLVCRTLSLLNCSSPLISDPSLSDPLLLSLQLPTAPPPLVVLDRDLSTFYTLRLCPPSQPPCSTQLYLLSFYLSPVNAHYCRLAAGSLSAAQSNNANLKRVVRVSEDFLTPQNHYFDFHKDEAGLCGGNFLLISVFWFFVFCCKYHAVIRGGTNKP